VERPHGSRDFLPEQSGFLPAPASGSHAPARRGRRFWKWPRGCWDPSSAYCRGFCLALVGRAGRPYLTRAASQRGWSRRHKGPAPLLLFPAFAGIIPTRTYERLHRNRRGLSHRCAVQANGYSPSHVSRPRPHCRGHPSTPGAAFHPVAGLRCSLASPHGPRERRGWLLRACAGPSGCKIPTRWAAT